MVIVCDSFSGSTRCGVGCAQTDEVLAAASPRERAAPRPRSVTFSFTRTAEFIVVECATRNNARGRGGEWRSRATSGVDRPGNVVVVVVAVGREGARGRREARELLM